MPKQQPEFLLQCALAQYLRVQYPRVMFRSDVGSQLKLSQFQAVNNKKIQADDFKCPDMMIFKAKQIDGQTYHGLFLELKNSNPWLSPDRLRKSPPNLKNQWRDIIRLRDEGYFADFFWSFGQAIKTIDWYLGEKK
jgi:hypothetical protein